MLQFVQYYLSLVSAAFFFYAVWVIIPKSIKNPSCCSALRVIVVPLPDRKKYRRKSYDYAAVEVAIKRSSQVLQS